MSTRRNDHTYRKRRSVLKAHAIAEGWDCHLCKGAKGPILFDESYQHPLSFTADHVLAVAGEGKGNMLGQLAPAH